MEKRGYIRREPVEQDGRLKRLVLTEQGKSGHQQVIEDIQYLDARLMDGISREDQEIFWNVVEKMEENAERVIKGEESEKC